ncbi:MAG: 30S ribosomal protein S6 [Patescibacteria group bacterium]|jgi:small subunit ribosomal protein S6
MQHYEMLFVLPARATQEELDGHIQEVVGIVEKAGGAMTKKEIFAQQKLAYPIKKETQGVYILTEFDMEPTDLIKAETELRHLPILLRHQILKKKVKTAEQIESERMLKEKIASKRIAKSEKVKQEEVAKVAKEKAAEKPEAKKQEKIDIEELDKKLEELLDDPLLKG